MKNLVEIQQWDKRGPVSVNPDNVCSVYREYHPAGQHDSNRVVVHMASGKEWYTAEDYAAVVQKINKAA